MLLHMIDGSSEEACPTETVDGVLTLNIVMDNPVFALLWLLSNNLRLDKHFFDLLLV